MLGAEDSPLAGLRLLVEDSYIQASELLRYANVVQIDIYCMLAPSCNETILLQLV
jgi:hypothetical protein